MKKKISIIIVVFSLLVVLPGLAQAGEISRESVVVTEESLIEVLAQEKFDHLNAVLERLVRDEIKALEGVSEEETSEAEVEVEGKDKEIVIADAFYLPGGKIKIIYY